jgi:21S rRNA (GM2251-2'-O)-methyltransferase
MHAYGRRLLLRDTSRTVSLVFVRQASLTGAINRGIRKTQRGVETAFEGVRNNRSDDARERAPWQAKTERRLGGKDAGERGWQRDVERYGQGQRPPRDGAFDGSDSKPRQSYNRNDTGSDRGGRGGGGGFNRDNADRRERYEERKSGLRERGPPPNRDGPNREERRRAMFGKPFSGKPQHDRDFMESHVTSDRETYHTRSTSPNRAAKRYEPEEEEEDDFEEAHTESEAGGWKAEDVEKEWAGRKSTFQPEFTRARDMQGLNRGDRDSRPKNYSDRNDRREPFESSTGHRNRDSPRREEGEVPKESFRRSQPSGEHFIPKDDPAPKYRQRAQSDETEDLDEDVEMPTLEQRRNKFRPARKLERSLIDTDKTSKISTSAPASVPFTTAASSFLFGTFSVQEAIRAGRRTLYTLYLFRGQSIEAPTTPESYQLISKLAMSRGCKIKEISGEGWSRLLNKMTASRPHNGWVLEASEIPKLPVTSLLPMEGPQNTFSINLGHQSVEDLAINAAIMEPGSSPNSGVALISSIGQMTRYPLVLLLDRIMDPGNLGAIIRSAHFLGVDALVVLEHSSAPFNNIMLKVAAGAAEYLPILVVKNEHDLVKSSKKNGWRFFAAISPDAVSAQPDSLGRNRGKMHLRTDVPSALSKGPVVLMLGSEGEGLRPHLQKLADGIASIKNARGENAGVDSLNVSVASALLCQEFLRGPHAAVGEKEAVPLPFSAVEEESIEGFTDIGVGESEAEMEERQEEKVF